MAGDTVTNPQGWQPIATAPKDGTRVLLYPCTTGPHHKGKAVVGYGYWHQPGNPERLGFWMHAFNGSKRANLTHWMPIPAPDSVVLPQAEYARLVEALDQASNFLNILEIQYELRKNGDLRFNSAVIDFEDLTRAASIKSLCDAALKAAREGGKV